MATVPSSARVVVIGAGIVGNSLVYHLARLGWRDIVQIDKGPLPNPGRLDRARVELHLPGRPLARDHRPHRSTACGSTRRWASSPSPAASRSPAPRSGWRSSAGGCRRRKAWGIEAGAGHARSRSPRRCRSSTRGHRRRVLDPDGRRRRLAARRHDHARAGPGAGRPDRRAHRRGHRDGRRGRAGSAGSAPPAATSRPRPSSSPAASGARSSPRWPARTIPLTPAVHQMISVGPVPQLAEKPGRDLLPDRPRHGHVLLRAPARRATWRSAPTRTGRSCTTPRTSPRSSRRSCRRPRCRSPPTTSTRSSSRRSS